MKLFILTSIFISVFSHSASAEECLSFPKILSAENLKSGVHFSLGFSSDCSWTTPEGTCREGYQSYSISGLLKYKYIEKSYYGKTAQFLDSFLFFVTDSAHSGWIFEEQSLGYIPGTSETKLSLKNALAGEISEIRTKISKVIFESDKEVCDDSFYKE